MTKKVLLKVAIGILMLLLILLNINSISISKNPEHKTPKKIDLQILYAGHVGSEREDNFYKFLDRHFEKVEKTNLKSFSPKIAEGYDVIILDYDGEGFDAPRPDLDLSYKKPTVTIGVLGAFLASSRNLKLKTRYL